MKKIIVAAMLAFGSLAATAAPSLAETVIIRTDRGYHPVRHEYREHRDYRAHRWERMRDRRHGCRTKTVRSYHHGRVVTRTTRVCR